MSDNWITVVPLDPWLSVAPERLEAGRAWLANKGSSHSEAKVQIFDKPQFFDAGANFPRSGALLAALFFPWRNGAIG